MLQHIKKLAVAKVGTPDEVVVLSNISEGVDGSSTFGYETEEVTLTIEDGQTINNAIEHTLDVRTLLPTDADITTLRGWSDGQTPVFVSAVGIDGALLIGDFGGVQSPVYFYTDNQYSDAESVKIFATAKTLPGYNSDTNLYYNGWFAGDNLLRISDDENFTNRDILFPFAGETVTFAATITANTGGTISVEAFDVSDTSLDSVSETLSDTRLDVTMTTPPNTYYLRVHVDAGATFNSPSLRMGANSNYTKY